MVLSVIMFYHLWCAGQGHVVFHVIPGGVSVRISFAVSLLLQPISS